MIGKATHSKTFSASFLADLQEDYELYGKGIFALMRERYPVEYFRSLVQVLKIEVGGVGAFDRPATTVRLWIGSSSALARRRGRCWSSSWSR